MLHVRKNPECHWLRIVLILRVGFCGSWYLKLDFIFIYLSLVTLLTGESVESLHVAELNGSVAGLLLVKDRYSFRRAGSSFCMRLFRSVMIFPCTAGMFVLGFPFGGLVDQLSSSCSNAISLISGNGFGFVVGMVEFSEVTDSSSVIGASR